MENSVHTFESVWVTFDRVGERFDRVGEKLDRVAEQQAENDRILTEKFKESDRAFNEKLDRIAAESAQRQAENERILNEKFAELKENQAETDRQFKKAEKLITNLGVRLGGMANSHGSFAEEYFFNAFDNGETNFFGEKFDEIEKNLKYRRNGLKAEYDIVMFNHTSVAIIEVKYRARETDLPDALKKVDTFRILFPDYKDFKIYLGLASMSFYSELEKECEENGIAIIKQVGDKVIINDKHLKVF
jgi:hypothetical protein